MVQVVQKRRPGQCVAEHRNKVTQPPAPTGDCASGDGEFRVRFWLVWVCGALSGPEPYFHDCPTSA